MSTEQESLALEDKRCAAMCGKDFAALDALFHVALTGKGEIEVTAGCTAKSLELRFPDVWTKGAKGWQFIAWQSTRLGG